MSIIPSSREQEEEIAQQLTHVSLALYELGFSDLYSTIISIRDSLLDVLDTPSLPDSLPNPIGGTDNDQQSNGSTHRP